jgi:hypothetical protein
MASHLAADVAIKDGDYAIETVDEHRDEFSRLRWPIRAAKKQVEAAAAKGQGESRERKIKECQGRKRSGTQLNPLDPDF